MEPWSSLWTQQILRIININNNKKIFKVMKFAYGTKCSHLLVDTLSSDLFWRYHFWSYRFESTSKTTSVLLYSLSPRISWFSHARSTSWFGLPCSPLYVLGVFQERVNGVKPQDLEAFQCERDQETLWFKKSNFSHGRGEGKSRSFILHLSC